MLLGSSLCLLGQSDLGVIENSLMSLRVQKENVSNIECSPLPFVTL